MLCQLELVDGVLKCSRCGRVVENYVRSIPPEKHYANCRGDGPPPEKRLRLGSAIKAGLDKIGVTQDRVAALVESIGLPPSCLGCAKRQEALDEFDRKAELWLSKAALWIRGIPLHKPRGPDEPLLG